MIIIFYTYFKSIYTKCLLSNNYMCYCSIYGLAKRPQTLHTLTTQK